MDTRNPNTLIGEIITSLFDDKTSVEDLKKIAEGYGGDESFGEKFASEMIKGITNASLEIESRFGVNSFYASQGVAFLSEMLTELVGRMTTSTMESNENIEMVEESIGIPPGTFEEYRTKLLLQVAISKSIEEYMKLLVCNAILFGIHISKSEL